MKNLIKLVLSIVLCSVFITACASSAKTEGESATTIKWAPIVALVAGALTGWLTPGFGIVSINAMVVAILVYFIGSAIEKGIRR